MPKASSLYVALIVATCIIAAIIASFMGFRIVQNYRKRRRESVKDLGGDILGDISDRKRRFSMTEYDDLPTLDAMKRQRRFSQDIEDDWITSLKALQREGPVNAETSEISPL